MVSESKTTKGAVYNNRQRPQSQMSTDSWQVGDWVRYWADHNHLSKWLGQITGFGEAEASKNWHDGEFAWVTNAQMTAAVKLSDLIEKIDPIIEWEKLRPGESVPEWLVRRVTGKQDGQQK